MTKLLLAVSLATLLSGLFGGAGESRLEAHVYCWNSNDKECQQFIDGLNGALAARGVAADIKFFRPNPDEPKYKVGFFFYSRQADWEKRFVYLGTRKGRPAYFLHFPGVRAFYFDAPKNQIEMGMLINELAAMIDYQSRPVLEKARFVLPEVERFLGGLRSDVLRNRPKLGLTATPDPERYWEPTDIGKLDTAVFIVQQIDLVKKAAAPIMKNPQMSDAELAKRLGDIRKSLQMIEIHAKGRRAIPLSGELYLTPSHISSLEKIDEDLNELIDQLRGGGNK
jgi:hypothetical protein